jgi:hypothetical protein
MECGDNSVLSFGDKNLIIVAIAPPKTKTPECKMLSLADRWRFTCFLRAFFFVEAENPTRPGVQQLRAQCTR